MLTRPLVAFLLLVLSVLAYSAYCRLRTPGVQEAIRLLADGDLDGVARTRTLQALVNGTRGRPAGGVDAGQLWAGLLAAVELGDRTSYSALCADLGGTVIPKNPPTAESVPFLDLGNPMLGNFRLACQAEAAGDHAGAIEAWGHVHAECLLADSPLALGLANAALTRLR